MLAIVRIALSRPYTFVVMAMLIAIFGVISWIKTPTDIFPNIGIPVIAAVFTYNGLPPDAMSGRVVYYYERTLSSQVNDIQHIESQSLSGYGVVKIYFQPSVNIEHGDRADHRRLADGAEAAAAGHHAALRARVQRLERCRSSSSRFRARACRRQSSPTTGRTSYGRSSPRSPARPCPRPTAARSSRSAST